MALTLFISYFGLLTMVFIIIEEVFDSNPSNIIFGQSSINDTEPLNKTQEWISENPVHISTGKTDH